MQIQMHARQGRKSNSFRVRRPAGQLPLTVQFVCVIRLGFIDLEYCVFRESENRDKSRSVSGASCVLSWMCALIPECGHTHLLHKTL